jgi:DNA-binding PucR family transcriptional regulator
MSLPTLRDILELPVFRSAEVLSGQSCLDNVITWVHVAEVLNVWRFLSGGELILTTGLELARTTPQEQVNYLRSLAQAGVHGLVIELVQAMRDVPDELLEVAREIQFPLIVFRQEVRFEDLTRAAHERILRPQAGWNKKPGLAPLIDALIETGRDDGFLCSQLGPLLSLPSRPRCTLLGTIETLMQSQFNVAETARRLGVRRQSIYYRLDQIYGLLGALDAPERRAGLSIALALLRHRSRRGCHDDTS